LGNNCRLTETVFSSTTEDRTLSDTALNAFCSPTATARSLSETLAGFPWARAIFAALGVMQVNDKNASEKPKITPISTRLKTSRFFDDSFWIKFMCSSSIMG